MLRTRSSILLLTAIVVGGCGAQTVEDRVGGKPVVITYVEPTDLEERIAATGELIAKHHAEVAAQVGGEITQLLLDEGDAAASDAVVLEIDPERHELELARARARVDEAAASLSESQRDVKRKRALARRDVGSKAQLDESETGAQTARSRLAAAQAALGVAERAVRDSKVRARFDGLIARRLVSVGEFVQRGQKLFELVSLSPIEVEFHLPEVDSGRVRIGQALEVEVAPYPDEVFSATVSVISPLIDSRTRTLRVKAVLENKEGRLRPGLFARTDLGVALREGVLMVPEEAVSQRADGAVVFRVKGDRVERRIVETGLIRAGQVEIRSGLAAGDAIVRRGQATLIDGSVVMARNPDGSPAVAASAARTRDEGPAQ